MAREFRVYGPPGTGKTTYIAKQAERAIDKFGTYGVVIASLTRAAAAEIASRAGKVPPNNVGTLHAHAWRALGRPKIAESSEGLKLWNERAKSYHDKIESKASLNPENAPLEAVLPTSDAEAMLAEMSVYRQRMMPRELWPMRVQRFAKKWDQFKADTGMIDFTDLIERAISEIDEHPAKPGAFLLDEAQDMSKLEMTLARKWGAKCQVFVIVGDPYQNLYQWRGSDPEAFTAGEVEGVKVLDQSYRVPALPQKYAVGFVRPIVPEGEDFPEYRPKEGAEGFIDFKPHSFNYPEPLIRDVMRDVEAGKTAMILASCGYMLTPLVAALRAQGIPFHNPYRHEHGGWNPLRYADRIRAFLRLSQGTVWTYDDLHLWVEPLKAKGVLRYGSKSQIELMTQKQFGDDSHAKTPLKVSKVLAYFEPEAHEPVISCDLDWYMANTRSSRASVVEYAAKLAQKHGAKALDEEPKVIVGTIHSVKGGEADSVYVFPDLSRKGYESWNRRNGRDAIIRQFYVALTRTRDKLTILEPNGHEYCPLPRTIQ